MKLFYKKYIILPILFFYIPFTSMAWGVLGHRIIGEVADSYVTSNTKKQIAAILGNESVAMASNWPDFIKSDTNYNYLNTWHYINFDSGISYQAFKNYLASDTATDAYTKINFLTKELKKKTLSKEKKILYLRLLIHIVGDIHQPLHVGRFSDLGGNKIRVQWFNDPTNLHTVWDTHLVNFQQLSYTEYTKAINFTTRLQRKAWQQAPIGDWIYESYQIAEKIYSDIEPNEKLGYTYNFSYVNTVNEQLLKGGVRLAGLLNSIFI